MPGTCQRRRGKGGARTEGWQKPTCPGRSFQPCILKEILPALPSGGSEGAARPCPQHLRFSGSFIAKQNPRILSLLTVTVSPSRESGLGCSAPGIPGSASLITAREGQPGAKTSQAPIRAVSSHGGENWIWGREGAAGGKANPSRHFTVGRQWGDGASSRCKA